MKIACITPQGKRDYTTECLLEGFHQLGHELIVSDPGNGFCDSPMSDEAFVRAANNADVLVAFFGKARNCAPPRHHLIERVKLPWVRKAYVDGSEWRADGWDTPRQVVDSLDDPSLRRGEPWLNEDMFHLCCHYFKRECYPVDTSSRGVIPLPFALCDRHILTPNAVRDIDVFCSFGHTKTGLRREAIEVVSSFANDLNVVVKSGMSQAEYQSTLARSRIVVDAWGGGDTTDRFWEGVGAEACVLYQRHQVVTPNPFVGGLHAVSYGDENELKALIVELTARPGIPEEIGRKGLEHAMRYHTAKHRAQLILDTVFAPR